MEAVSTTGPNVIASQKIAFFRDIIQFASMFCYTFNIVNGGFLTFVVSIVTDLLNPLSYGARKLRC
jgi:hypothetical protein